MANQVIKRGRSVKGVIKHAEQTAVRQKEQILSPEANIQRTKQEKQEIMPILSIYRHLYRFDDKMECQFHATTLI